MLGKGSFGEVYLCLDRDTGRELACKEVKLVTINDEVSRGSLYTMVKDYGALTEAVTGRYTRANILRDNSGKIKLADFGSSKRLKTIVECSGIEKTNSFVGTAHWMAPEVIKGENYDRKADIWSVGCTVLYDVEVV
ncbi:M3K3-like protein [Mya arenaria]|uniref:M3K3-like protein n=1 Tax=Mya arenaria TaxID=6604 RepID=A0ABY7F0Z5_MYAAR|nr:M3K3-like protein [Mya arenaria]